MELSTRIERMNKRKMEAECSTRYIRNRKTDYKMVAASAAPNDYDRTLTLIDEKETLNLSGIPRTLKIGNPHNGALPLLL